MFAAEEFLAYFQPAKSGESGSLLSSCALSVPSHPGWQCFCESDFLKIFVSHGFHLGLLHEPKASPADVSEASPFLSLSPAEVTRSQHPSAPQGLPGSIHEAQP